MADNASAIALTFHETTFDLVEHAEGERWLRLLQIEGALGYKAGGRALSLLYERNAAEFTPPNDGPRPGAHRRGGAQEVRIFSLRGAHLLGMFARTARAAEFRRWVLDVLPPPTPLLIGTTLQRVTEERDQLRKLLGEWLLQHKPRYHVLRYYHVPGLSNVERARLMGWKSTTRYYAALRELAAAGLVDWTPDPQRQALGRRVSRRLVQAHEEGTLRTRREKGPGATPEQMAAARAARVAKLAAMKGAAQ